VALVLAVIFGGCDSSNARKTVPSGPPAAAAVPTPARVPAQQTVQGFVKAIYAEGVPYQQARAFGPAAVNELLTLLNDPSMADARSNIVVTLGMIGGDKAEDELRQLVARGTGKLTQPEFTLRLNAQMALGYAANVAKTIVTLDYLIASLQSGVWDSRVSWQPPNGGSPFPRLRERSIMALGLSGKPQAGNALEQLLKGEGGGRGGAPLTRSDQEVVKEALLANQYLRTHSLAQYFVEYRR